MTNSNSWENITHTNLQHNAKPHYSNAISINILDSYTNFFNEILTPTIAFFRSAYFSMLEANHMIYFLYLSW